ncbi:CYFA0S35e00342g1_1 [Cyberlindnera fabianii]|uniref:amidase n=1 Tax=Cyberlindnera fabianii TaxID=36022 RepID=A0A061BCD2_CYBFA|nr:CYFA0S35e00342g1_1 [Cyberlindnera fabianii]
MSYKDISAKKRAERDSKFKPEWLVPEEELPGPEVLDVLQWPVSSGYLSASEIEITEAPIATIRANIKSKKWTAVTIAKAFMHRATIAHQLVNCLTEVFFDLGLEMAASLDKYYEETGQLIGPYHGIPISLKDNLIIRGQPASIGVVCLAYDPPSFTEEDESPNVKTLRSLGAVFYVKTSVPTAMMIGETMNNLYGYTLNPFNRNLTCGGSSGGEGALVAMKGSVFGIGGDIGGSLRIPSAFQNLFTLRATSGRLPGGGRAALVGLESVPSVQGPMARELCIVEEYCQIMTDLDKNMENLDVKFVPYGWRQVVDLPEKLTFAIAREDDKVHPYPSILRGMDIVIEKLKSAGHEIIEWDPTGQGEFDQLVHSFFTSDGGNKIKKLHEATGEPFFEFMHIYRDAKEISVSDLWDMQSKRNGIVKKFIKRWDGTAKLTSSGKPIDGLLLPTSPYSGAPLNKNQYCGYTSVFNGLDWPAGTVPVTRADKEIDLKEVDYKPKNDTDQLCYDSYDADKCHGGAISVQVVGRKLQDEKVLKMMKIVAQCCGTLDYWTT